MKRQYINTLAPGPGPSPNAFSNVITGQRTAGGGNCPENISDTLIFERWGDDSQVYFIDPVQQFLVNSGPAPIDLDTSLREVRKKEISVLPGKQEITELSDDYPQQTFLLHDANSSVKIFLDAWLPYQTVPINVFASARPSYISPSYHWEFHNYIPIGGTAVSGSGSTPVCPSGPMTLLRKEYSPIIRTLGHTNRTPMGEFPVSEETKRRACYCAGERPYLVFSHTGPNGTAPILVTIGIAV